MVSLPETPARAQTAGHVRHFVAQHLQEPPDAVVAQRRTDENRHDQALLQVALQIVEYLIARRRNIGEQLFHQMLVVIGELFQHLEARFGLARLDLVVHVDQFGSGVLAIDIGALQREIDESRWRCRFPRSESGAARAAWARRSAGPRADRESRPSPCRSC